MPGPVVVGYHSARGVVTFSDRAFNKDCLFIQVANAGIFISQADRLLCPQLKVGQAVEISGNLLPSKHTPILQPMVVDVLGWQSLPEPVIQPAGNAGASYEEGLWTEIEGVVRSVNTNGGLMLMGKHGAVVI
jgi:hypothetical protein